MNLSATARSIPGSLRQEIVIDGRHHLTTDEPVAVGGEGTAPAPHELLVAALASCVSTVLVMYARTKQWDLGEVTVAVDYDHHATPRQADITIRVSGALTVEQLSRLEKVAASCPVRRSVEVGIEFSERIEVAPPGVAQPQPARVPPPVADVPNVSRSPSRMRRRTRLGD